MIICHCKQVTDRQVRDAMARGACSRKQIVLACGAGAECGGCVPAVDELLEQSTPATHADQTLVSLRSRRSAA